MNRQNDKYVYRQELQLTCEQCKVGQSLGKILDIMKKEGTTKGYISSDSVEELLLFDFWFQVQFREEQLFYSSLFSSIVQQLSDHSQRLISNFDKPDRHERQFSRRPFGVPSKRSPVQIINRSENFPNKLVPRTGRSCLCTAALKLLQNSFHYREFPLKTFNYNWSKFLHLPTFW